MSELLWPLYIYHSIRTNSRGRLGSLLDPEGSFHFWTPGVLRERPEIGYYVHDIGPERALEFRSLVEDAHLLDLPGIHALRPEQPTVYIMTGDWEGTRRSVTWSMDALPPELLPVMDAFHHLVDEASASPRRVLAGTVRWGAANFSTREPLRFEFTLRNKGTEAITFQSPMAPHEGTCMLHLFVSQVPVAGVETPRRQRIALTPDTLSRPDQAQPHAKGPPGERLELAPGQSVRFVATPSAYLSPAEHQAVLLLDTGGGAEGVKNHVRGVLAVDLPPLRIVHR